MAETELRTALVRFAQKVERRALALVAGDASAAKLEQTNVELAADEICALLTEPTQGAA